MSNQSKYYREVFELYPESAVASHLPDLINMVIRHIRDGYDRFSQKSPGFEAEDVLEFLQEFHQVAEEMSRRGDGLTLQKEDLIIRLDPLLRFLEANTIGDLLVGFTTAQSYMTMYLHQGNMADYKVCFDLLHNWFMFVIYIHERTLLAPSDYTNAIIN